MAESHRARKHVISNPPKYAQAGMSKRFHALVFLADQGRKLTPRQELFLDLMIRRGELSVRRKARKGSYQVPALQRE